MTSQLSIHPLATRPSLTRGQGSSVTFALTFAKTGSRRLNRQDWYGLAAGSGAGQR